MKYIYLTSKIDASGVYDPATPVAFTSSKLCLLNGIPTGYTENQRIGRIISMERIVLNIDLETGVSYTVIGSETRVLVIYYKHPNGAPVDVDTFMHYTADTIKRPCIRALNEKNASEIEILADKSVGYANRKLIQLDIDLGKRITCYSGDTEFQDHVQHGGLYLLALSGNYGAGTADPVGYLDFAGTLYYNDK